MFCLYPRLAFAIALTLAAGLGRAADTGYQVFDLGVLDGTISSSALGINNHGQVVGQAAGENVLLPTAFLWSEATGMQDLSASLPDSLRSIAYGVNNDGGVVGEVRYPVLGFRAFALNTQTSNVQIGLIEGGNRSDARAINSSGVVAGRSNYVVDLGGGTQLFPFRATSWAPGSDPVKLNALVENNGSSAFGRGINENGVIVGTSIDSNSVSRGVAWLASGELVELLPFVGPGQSDTGSSANGINDDSGLIVGTTTGTDSGRAAIWTLPAGPGTAAAELLGQSDPNAKDNALDINNAGDAVGYADHGNSLLHAVVWDENGIALDLSTDGIFVDASGQRITLAQAGFNLLSVANALNDNGWIVGQGMTGDGSLHAFLLKPAVAVPEPQTWALLLAGLAGLGWLRRASARRS